MISKIKNLKNDKGFMAYFKNTSWLFSEKILRIFLGIFVGVWITRYLGPEQFGLFSYAQSFVALFSAVATLGLDGIVIRELVLDESKRDILLGTSFLLKLIGSIILLIFLAVAVIFTSNDMYTNMLVFIIASATIFQSFNVIDFYFQSKVLGKYVAFSNTISLLISSIIKIILILINAPLMAFAIVILFDAIVLSLGLIYFYMHKNLSFKSWKFDMNIALKLLKDSWPLIFSGMVLMVQARIDQIMLKEMMGYLEVGYYGAALTIIESLGFMPVVLINSLTPAIIYAKKVSENVYFERLLNFYRLNFLLFMITALPFMIFGNMIIKILFGSEYLPAGVLLQVMSLRLFFTNMGTARGMFILVENLYKYSMFTMILGTLTNIILNYMWIGKYGALGAVYATICSFFVTIFLIDIFYSGTKKNTYDMIKGIITFYKLRVN